MFYDGGKNEGRTEKWSVDLKEDLIRICNQVDRTWLSDRLPNPYTIESADWWLKMVGEKEGKEGIFQAILLDGKVVGNISVTRLTAKIYEPNTASARVLEKNGFALEGRMRKAAKKAGQIYDVFIYGRVRG